MRETLSGINTYSGGETKSRITWAGKGESSSDGCMLGVVPLTEERARVPSMDWPLQDMQISRVDRCLKIYRMFPR